jgi:hypothetical protein
MPIIFSIEDEKTKQLVKLGETTGDSTIQRQVDIIFTWEYAFFHARGFNPSKVVLIFKTVIKTYILYIFVY